MHNKKQTRLFRNIFNKILLIAIVTYLQDLFAIELDSSANYILKYMLIKNSAQNNLKFWIFN